MFSRGIRIGGNCVVSGQDWKIKHAPGTNQIAGFDEFRPTTH